MKKSEHEKVVSKLKKRLLANANKKYSKLEQDKNKLERQNTPKGVILRALHDIILVIDKVRNRR